LEKYSHPRTDPIHDPIHSSVFFMRILLRSNASETFYKVNYFVHPA
jgi:hypothetical protein